jgi:hypothetical protein
LLLLGLVAGGLILSSCGQSAEPRDVVVRVFIDVDEDGTVGEGDLMLPGVVVGLDDASVATTDATGQATFSSVSARRHEFSVAEEDLVGLEDAGLTCLTPTLQKDVGEAGDVEFVFVAQGFLDVNVEETP